MLFPFRILQKTIIFNRQRFIVTVPDTQSSMGKQDSFRYRGTISQPNSTPAALLSTHIDSRFEAIRIDPSTFDLSFSGYDKAQAIVANSALLDRWTFKKTNLLQMARELAKPFGIKVSLASGLQLPTAPAKVAVSPGDSAFDAVIPHEQGLALRAAIGDPETIVLPTGHYGAIIFLSYIEGAAMRFFESRFEAVR